MKKTKTEMDFFLEDQELSFRYVKYYIPIRNLNGDIK